MAQNGYQSEVDGYSSSGSDSYFRPNSFSTEMVEREDSELDRNLFLEGGEEVAHELVDTDDGEMLDKGDDEVENNMVLPSFQTTDDDFEIRKKFWRGFNIYAN